MQQKNDRCCECNHQLIVYDIPNVREQGDKYGIGDFPYRSQKTRGKHFKCIFLKDHIVHLDVHDAIVTDGKQIAVSLDSLYFNHYQPLTTRWKPWEHADIIDDSIQDHVLDIEARKRIEEVGLG